MNGPEPDRPRDDRAGTDRLVSVRRVPDEATATLLADFLGDQGIEATIHPMRIPWLGGADLMHRGYWGHLEVLERDAERARALIDDFFAARPEADPGLAGGGPDEDDAPEAGR